MSLPSTNKDLTYRAVQKVLAGDTRTARMLCRFAGEDIFIDGNVKTSAMMGWLGRALQNIADGMDANEALGLARKKQRPDNPERDLCIAVSYWVLRKQGMKASDARKLTAEEWGLSAERIKHIERRQRDVDFEELVISMIRLKYDGSKSTPTF